MAIENITYSPGYITHVYEGSKQTSYAIADVLRALDIPVGLTYEQVGAISTLANLVVVLIRTLIFRKVLNESFLEEDDYDLNAIIKTIEDMGGDFGEPDLTVT